jgi:gliding motility-associated-like protein
MGSVINQSRNLIIGCAVMLLSAFTAARAQEFVLANGTVNTCVGALVDPGGGLAPYGDNEDVTMTICPDTPGQGITLSFLIAELSTAGSAPTDRVEVYNGDGISAPLFGSFTGDDLEGQVFSATPDNPTGCLTIHFTSNEIGGGDLSAVIQCGTPCYPPVPTALVLDHDLPAQVCLNEELTFDASGSTAATGQTIVSYAWDLDDGTNATGPIVSHTFDEAGEYLVRLTLTDDAGCVNTQQTSLQVLVGTTPSFLGTIEDQTVCEGATVQLFGAATATTWTGLPVIDLGGPIPLPDNVGVPFNSSLDFSVFPNGATLNNVNDLASICVDMEHSYMGDMVLTMTCPNGQSVNLHQQGGLGTFLGDANATEPPGSAAIPGTCFTYCFAPNAPNGTWVQCSQTGPTPNVIPVSQGTALAPGTYTSVQSLNNLVGCPLNGTWTFTLIDQLAVDNGVICNWSINFDPSLYPDITTFTPVIGSTPDSVSWSGPGLSLDPLDAYSAVAVVNDPGVFDYTLSVTDNFGCTFDTTITITVTPAPVIDANVVVGPTCSDPATLFSSIVANPPPPPTCIYTLILEDSFGDGWDGGAQITVNISGSPTVYTLPDGDDVSISLSVQTGQVIQLVYTAGTVWNNENSFTLIGPGGNTIHTSPNGPVTGVAWQGAANCGPNVGPPVYQWTPATGAVTPNTPNTLTQINEPTTFVVRVHTFGQPWCGSTDTVLVQAPSVLQNDTSIMSALCHDSTGVINVVTSGAGGPWNYLWRDADGVMVREANASLGDELIIGAGTYTVIVTEGPLGNNCIDTLVATILAPEPLEWTGVPADTTICLTGTASLSATAAGGTAPYSLIWDQGLVGSGPHAVGPTATENYQVTLRDANGCPLDTLSAVVTVLEALQLNALEDMEECYGTPVLFEVLGGMGGNGELSYDWGFGPGNDNSLIIVPTVDTTICVTLNDGCETPTLTRCADLTLLRTPPMTFFADTVLGCAPLPVEFQFVDTTGGAQITWVLGDGDVISGDTTLFHTFGPPGYYDVGVEVIWPNGCITDTNVVDMIRVLSVPSASFTWSPQPPSVLEPEVEFEDLSMPNVVSWSWNFHDSLYSTEQHPVIEYPSAIGGYYPVSLVVRNELGCADSSSRVVHVEDLYLVLVPNAFTPNGDGDNDRWGVSGNDIAEEEFELRVFDRWGQEVFASSDRYATWDGSWRNSGSGTLAEGVYAYRLAVRSALTQQERIILGHVSLLP